MKPARCSICGVAHWLSEGHQWPKEAAKPAVEVPPVVLGVASNKSSASNTVHLTKSNVAADEGVKKQRWDREKYNAYQRELMREKRAARKAGVSP